MDKELRSLIERMRSALDCINEDVDGGGHADACGWSVTNEQARCPEVCRFCEDLLVAEALAREASRLLGDE